MLSDTNKFAPGKHPYQYGGPSGRQIITQDKGANILCYKWLNMYQMKTEQWIKAQKWRLRHHKGCNFNLLYVNIDSKYIKTKYVWRDKDKEDDDEKKQEEIDKKEEKAEEQGSDDEQKGKTKNLKKDDTDPDADEKKKTWKFNKEYGVYESRHFYISSKSMVNYVLSIVRRRWIVMSWRTTSVYQKWYFCYKTRTIKSVAFKSKSLDIKNAG